MRLALLLLALAACDPAGPVLPTCGPDPDPPPFMQSRGLFVAECPAADATACLRVALFVAHADAARGVGIPRGVTYTYSGPIQVPDGAIISAVGDTLLPRPVLQAVPGAQIFHGNHATLYHLDIRGWRYGQTHYPVHLFDDWQHPGVNAALKVGWAVIGTSIDGFPGTCLLAADASDVLIHGSRVAHCGYSGLSVFPGVSLMDCGRGVTVTATVLEHNGQNGMDACASDAHYDVVARGNGWDALPGDGNGVLVFWDRPVENVRITGTMTDNRESGVRVRGLWLRDVAIDAARTGGNGHQAIDAPGATVGQHTLCTL
jgi:hypothetical protein